MIFGVSFYLKTESAGIFIQQKINTMIPGSVSWQQLKLSPFTCVIDFENFQLKGSDKKEIISLEKIQVNLVAGYTVPDLTKENDFKDILEQADNALQRATNSLTENVVCYDDEVEIEAPPVVVTEQDIEQAFSHVVDGNFYQIPEQHLAAVLERLSPFMQFADSRLEFESMAGSTVKNMAI